MKPVNLLRQWIEAHFGVTSRAALSIVAAGILAVIASPAYTRADVTLPVVGEELGATNPVGASDTNVFRDDEVALGTVTYDTAEDFAVEMYAYGYSDDLMSIADWDYVSGALQAADQNTNTSVQTAADCRSLGSATGRIQNPHNDQAAVAFFRTDGQVRVQRWGFNDEPRQETLLPGTTLLRRSVDVAVGDLDLVVDDEGYFHDEIVVARTANVLGSQCNVQVDVLDYDLSVLASRTIAYASCANYVATTIGDFDGDSKLEIALAMNGDSATNVQVVIGGLVDGVLSFGAPLSIARNHAGIDLASGDFAGTGREQIVAVTGAKGIDIFIVESSLYDPINPDSLPPLFLKSHFNGGNDYSSYTRVASGLFTFDPADGYDFGRRQFALATLDSSTKALKTYIYRVNSDYAFTVSASNSQTQSGARKIFKLDFAVGNFVGHGQTGESTSPTMHLAANFLMENGNGQFTREWRILAVSNAGGAITPGASGNWLLWWSSRPDIMIDPFVLPTDSDGDSWRLGIPIHITTDSAVSFNSLIEEPPKHVDYLPVNPDDLSKGFDMVNISGYKTFYVVLKQSSAEAISTQKTDNTNWSVGGGAELGGDFQVNLGRANNPKVRLDVNAAAKFTRSHDETTKDINAHYGSKTVTWTNSTDADDELDVSFQDVDIWRYPIIGFETGDTRNPMGYYEILVPGKSWGSQQGGKQYDWYAPLHVNNNVLSYPQTRTDQLDWLPADVGPFQVPVLDPDGNPTVDDDGNVIMKTETGLLADQTVYTWDGNKHTLDMQFTKTDKTSYQTTFSDTWSGSGDIGLGLSSKIKIPEPGVPLSFSLEGKAKLSASGHTSSGGETMGSTEMTKSSGVTLEIPPIIGFSQEGRSYSFATAVYSSTNGGGPKVAHTIVGLTDKASDWWVKQYGRAPDPALNLPFLFRQKDPDSQHANLNWWELKTADNDDFDTRHQMRGFFMRHNERDEATGEYELFNENPVDGDIVRLCARVYNFSLGQATGVFGADFYYYGWDKRVGKQVDPKTGEEVSEAIRIGKAIVPGLDSLSTPDGTTMREVCVRWDTTGLSKVANPDIRYRFLVNLDENDAVKGEIHELRDAQGNEAPAGNNSGRWPWTDGILVESPETPTAAGQELRLVDGVLQDASQDVRFWLAEGDLTVETAAGFLSGEPVVVGAGEECRIRARIASDSSYSGNVWVVFFDGRPSEGGKLIGVTLVRGLREGDNYAWTHWTPEAPGEHELRAYAFHRLSHANREGGTTWRMATVMSAPDAGGGASDGCSLTGGTVYGSASLLLFGFFWLAMSTWQRRYARQGRGRNSRGRTADRSITLLAMFGLSLGGIGTSVPADAQTVTIDDPAVDYQMWRDDEIFVPTIFFSGKPESTSYEYNAGAHTLSNPLPYCRPEKYPLQTAAAAGRIMSPYSDQVVVAYADVYGNVEVHFADTCNLANPRVGTGPWASLGPTSSMPDLVVPPVPGLPSWYDIATGDLDKHPDADSSYRDEVVVAYLTQHTNRDLLEPVVAVLDYAANASAPTITWMKVGDAVYKWTFSIRAEHDVPVIPLSVTTGDFDGDARKEIAVAYVRGWHELGVAVFRYTTTEIDEVVSHALHPESPLVLGLAKPPDFTLDVYQGPLDTAAGDFDGDGIEELAVAAIGYGYKKGDPRIAVDLKTFKANGSLRMTHVSTAVPYEDGRSGSDFVSGVQLTAGLFKYAPNAIDPTQNFDINRRQLALATNGSSGAVDIRTLVYDANLTPTLATPDAYQRIPASGSPPGRLSFRMAAGGFNGLQMTDSAADVVWSLAFTTWADNGQVLYLFDPDPSTGELRTAHFSQRFSTVANPYKSTSVVPLVAYDYGEKPTDSQLAGVLYGDSQYLGAPLYFRIDDVVTPDYILQEPPKHVFWNPDDMTVWNVSGQDAFTLGTTDTQSLGMTSEYHDTYDHSLGVSETGTFGITYGGIGLLPPKFEGSLSETMGYEFAEHEDDYNSDMTRRTVTLEHMATRDDAIKYRVQGIDVWRYPVFGVNLQDADGNEMPDAYLDITAPAPNVQTYLLGGIDASDWYQPVHENGNILSYPAPVGGANPSYMPADMGSFQVPCNDVTGKTCDHDEKGNVLSTQTITGPLFDSPAGFTWSGTGQTVSLTDSRTETQGKAHSWSKTLTNSEDLKLTGRIKLGVRPGGWKINLNLDVAFNGKWSWGGAHTMEVKTDDVKSIKLTVPAGVASEAYNVYPSFYVSNNGTTKVGFAVDTNTFGGKEFWERRYYAQPDPALNLPLRFNASIVNNVTVWTPNTEDSRRLMRGFFVRRGEADPDTGDYPEYAGPPTAGDQVRLEARVYNYSLGQTVNPSGGMKVRFDYAPINSGTHVVEEDRRTEIGTTTVGPIGPRGMTTAVIDWDTNELDLGSNLEQDYRIYVVLDPDDAVPNEKYETESPASRIYPAWDPKTGARLPDCVDPANLVPHCIDPGQNNEGWREVKVMANFASHPSFGQPADVHLQPDALAARDPSNPTVLLTDNVQTEEGQPLQLRVKVDTDMLGGDYGHLLLYDGDPEAGGTLISGKQAFTGNPDGSYVWAEWTPTEPGLHRLYAQVVESSMDTQPGNAIDDLTVMVHEATAPPTPEFDDGCTVTLTQDSRMAWWLLAPALVLAWAAKMKRRKKNNRE